MAGIGILGRDIDRVLLLRWGFEPSKKVAMIQLGLGVMSVIAIVAAVINVELSRFRGRVDAFISSGF
jgi:hypothetical protein